MLLLEKSQALEAHKTQLESDVKLLQSQLATTQAELRSADVTASSVPELTAQTHHLRADNARLVKLLASTAEYKSFMAYAVCCVCFVANVTFLLATAWLLSSLCRYAFPKDSSPRSDGRMRSVYVPPAVEPPNSAADHSSSLRLGDGPSRRSDASLVLADLTYDADAGSPQRQERAASDTTASWHDVQAYLHHYATADMTRVDHSSEGDHWVPEEAMDLASSFKRQHLSHVPPSLIREFLLELNHVWRRRFNKQCANVKERCVRFSGVGCGRHSGKASSRRMPLAACCHAGVIPRVCNCDSSGAAASGERKRCKPGRRISPQ